MYSSPRPSDAEIDAIYDDEFTGDPGANARVGEDGGPSERKIAAEERTARTLRWPILARFVDVEGSDILFIRDRTAALARIAETHGAAAWVVDPFRSNVEQARARGLDRCFEVPLTKFAGMLPGHQARFDCVCALTIHVLAHVPSPAALLGRLYELLKDDGILILDEKDVLEPANSTSLSPFNSGKAHLYHFTLNSALAYLRKAGFDIVFSGYDEKRKTSRRHFLIVARKPRTRLQGADPMPSHPALIAERNRVRRRLSYLRLALPLRALTIWARRQARSGRHALKARLKGPSAKGKMGKLEG